MTTTLEPTWRIHAYEPYWMTQADHAAVCDWLRANDVIAYASAGHDVEVLEVDGRRVIRCTNDVGEQTTVPLVADVPDIARPIVSHLQQLQAALEAHYRADLPAPVMVLGDCLAEEHAGLRPGGGYCLQCSQDSRPDVMYVAWPCPATAEAAERSGVTLW